MQKTITWTAGNGSEIKLALSIRNELDSQGHEIDGGLLEIEVIGEIDGEEVVAYDIEKVDHPVAVARFGRIGMTQANYDRYLAAEAELEAVIADHNKSRENANAKASSAIDAIDANTARIESAMRCGE